MPIEGIEMLWSSYDTYENGLNKLTAKKMLSDRSPSYMLARSFYKELRDLVNACDREALPEPPTEGSNNRILPWLNWIAWEKSDPLKIGEGPVLHARINYAYKCAMSSLRHYPEIAFDYSQYLFEKGLDKEAEAILKQSMILSPTNLLLSFALTNFYETSGSIPEAKSVLEGMISALDAKIATLDLSEGPLSIEAEQLISDITLSYIQYMQFCRRSEGIASARAIFTRARKLTHCTYQLYIAAAKMEYHCKKDPVVAGKIFELGMSRFGSDPSYVLEYLHHLIQLNDDTNTRALFERVLQSLGTPEALEIWKLYLDYEFHYGDAGSINALVKRFKLAYPDHPITKDISLVSRRFAYGELGPTEERMWLLLQVNPKGSNEVFYRAPKPKISLKLDLIYDLSLHLPPSHLYEGPSVDPELLVNLLRTANDPGTSFKPSKSTSSSTREKDRHGREKERSQRRHRSRSRSRRRESSGRSSRNRSRSPSHKASKHDSNSKHDDIFEQRHREREASRKK